MIAPVKLSDQSSRILVVVYINYICQQRSFLLIAIVLQKKVIIRAGF